jgi:superfamily II DNA or RNA helicase
MSAFEDALRSVLPDYEVPDDDLVGEVLIPAMRTADEVRIGAGFFSSACFAQIAPGLAAFIGRTSEPLKLLISPEIDLADRDAIERGVKSAEDVLRETTVRLFEDARLSEAAIVKHTLDCLAWLVAAQRLDVRFVLMKRGMYHKKKWLFRSGETWLAVHGSGNATTRGLLVNGEQMTIDRSWMDGEAAALRVERLVRQWERQWNNEHPHSLTLLAPQALDLVGRPRSTTRVPTVDDFWESWRADHAAGLEPPLPPNVAAPPAPLLMIPPDLEWRTGRYRHQGVAVDEFVATGRRGVLAIATGGGKTRTALIAATEVQNAHDGPMLLVVLVPTTPLMHQWARDVRFFGVEPILLSLLDGARRRTRLQDVAAAFSSRTPRTEVLVMSNALFAQDEALKTFIDSLDAGVLAMLIGDEMHNLGVASFLDEPPERFDVRLGLSATPVRQYDPDGTDALFAFFGPQIFEFSLADAIEAGCLTPYRYYLHEVELTHDEMQKYSSLTDELRAAGFRRDDDGQTIIPNAKAERLLRERRAVLEQASRKLSSLRDLLLQQRDGVRRTLIYTSAKPLVVETRRQIERVNELLSELGIVSHQLTSEETSTGDARDILDRFGRGDYQVITAMKVLDEGIDMPETDTAYLLASSTVQREWVQRRGRILRRVDGKESATLHDFLVIPPNPESDDGKSVLRGELARAEAFAQIAMNEWETGGPRSVISRYEDFIFAGRTAP